MSLRAHDHRAIPLCRHAHIDIEQHAGAFSGWTKEQVSTFCDVVATLARRTYLAIQESDFPR